MSVQLPLARIRHSRTPMPRLCQGQKVQRLGLRRRRLVRCSAGGFDGVLRTSAPSDPVRIQRGQCRDSPAATRCRSIGENGSLRVQFADRSSSRCSRGSPRPSDWWRGRRSRVRVPQLDPRPPDRQGTPKPSAPRRRDRTCRGEEHGTRRAVNAVAGRSAQSPHRHPAKDCNPLGSRSGRQRLPLRRGTAAAILI